MGSAAGTLLATALRILLITAAANQQSHTRAARCGERPAAREYGFLSRIVGGMAAEENSYPWIVSIKRRGKHICGGTIVSKNSVITAAHCVTDKRVVVDFTVCTGEHDLSMTEEPQTTFTIRRVILHPNFLQHKPINYDIAILELERNIVFDAKIFPVCMPSPDERFLPGSLCVALGWGRLSETGPVASVLQEVTLPIVEHEVCMNTLQTLGPHATFQTSVCAGYPEGGKDACQGDSGGPFLCPRSHGRWVLVGVTSWGMGCARTWVNNMMHPQKSRGSPGIFTDVKKMLHWLNLNLNQETSRASRAIASCSAKDQNLRGAKGSLRLPKPPKKTYSNNEMCTWTIKVPEGKHILLTFDHFDLEFDFTCDMDYLAVYFQAGTLIGKFCGGDRPRPLLITNNEVNLKFISNFEEHGTGISLSYLAVEPHAYPDSECGSVAVITGEGEIQTMNHPGEYSNYADCRWIVHCPACSSIQVTFQTFEVELSTGCVFDYVLIYHDLAGIDVAGKFCGFDIPDPVLSTSDVMQIVFSSDSRVNYGGFRATITFINEDTSEKRPAEHGGAKLQRGPQGRVVDVETGCSAAPIPPMFINQSITAAEEAVPNSWPWHVSINIGSKHICSGVIVSETFILTSASCVAQRRDLVDLLLVVAGVHDLHRSEDAQKCAVREITVHPEFTSLTPEHDIALLQLGEHLQFSDYVQPVCFPPSHSAVGPSSICVVSGWDLNGEGEASTKLQQLEVVLETDEVCQSYYGKLSESVSCVGTVGGEAKHTCLGESGSPLVCPSRDLTAFFIDGVTSRGFGCRGNAKPGAFTKIYHHVAWIQSITRGGDVPNGSAAQPTYTACDGVMSLESPGDVRLVASSQDDPEGFSCQIRLLAPADHFITLTVRELNVSHAHESQVVIYEGVSARKTRRVQLTEDTVPGTINSTGATLIIDASSSAMNAHLRIRLSFTYHTHN